MGEKYRFPHKNIVNETKAVSNRVSKLERNPRVIAASIDKGGLVVNGGFGITINDDGFLVIKSSGGGEPMIFARLHGTFTSDDIANWVLLSRADGSPVFRVFSDDQQELGTSIDIMDFNQASFVSDNSFYGGMRDPKLPVSWQDEVVAFATSTGATVKVAHTGFSQYHYVSFCNVDTTGLTAGVTANLELWTDYGSSPIMLDRIPLTSTTGSPVTLSCYTTTAASQGALIPFYPGELLAPLPPDAPGIPQTGQWVRLAVYITRTSGSGTPGARIKEWYSGGA